MTPFAAWFENRFAETLGWTLIHSLWQLSLIAAMVGAALGASRRRSANGRYLLACVGMMLFAAAPVLTYLYLLPSPQPVTSVETAPPHFIQLNVQPGQTSDTHFGSGFSSGVVVLPQVPLGERLTKAMRPFLPHALALYFLGVFLLAFRMALGYRQLRKLLHLAFPVTGPTRDQFDLLLTQLRIARPVRLLQSAMVEVPTMMGVIRPVILLPISALTGISPDQLSALLAHELAHIRRHDYLVNLLQSVIETLLFYHPAVWWLSSRIRQERENCCDDIAVAITDNRLAYAKALASMEALRTSPTSIPQGLLLTARGGALLPRIRRVLGLSPAPTPLLTASGAAFCLLLLCVLIYIGCGPASHASPPPHKVTLAPPLQDPSKDRIAVEARVILFPTKDLAALPIQWDLKLPGSLTQFVGTPDTVKKPNKLDFKATLIDEKAFTALLAALQNNKSAITVTAPRIILTDGQNGYIANTTQLPYIKSSKQTSNPPGANAAPATKPVLDVATFSTGLTLHLQATLSPDRRTISTALHPVFSILDGIVTFTTPDGALAQVPGITYMEFNTAASIPSGGTLVILGPNHDESIEVETGVPILSKIPGLNRLFTSRRYVKRNQTMLLIVQPTTLPKPKETPATQSAVPKIAIETRTLELSSHFMDDFRIDFNKANSFNGPNQQSGEKLFQTSIIDNWTLNMLLQSAQADKQTIIEKPEHITLAENQPVVISIDHLSKPASELAPAAAPATAMVPYAILNVSAAISADHRRINMSIKPQSLALPQSVASKISIPEGGILLIGGQKLPDNDSSTTTRPTIGTPATTPAADATFSVPDDGTILIAGPITNPGTPLAKRTFILIRPNIALDDPESPPPATLPSDSSAPDVILNRPVVANVYPLAATSQPAQ